MEHFRKTAFVVLLAGMAAAAGCADRPGSGPDTGGADQGGGSDGPGRDTPGGDGEDGDGSPVVCSGRAEADCTATAGCFWNVCPGCCDAPDVGSCQSDGTAVDCAACPPVACPVECTSLGAADCENNPPCVAATCPDCQGGESFVACYDPAVGGPPFACEPCAQDCASLDEQGCVASATCRADYCYDCSGSDLYQGCAEAGQAQPACPPPPVPCPVDPCSGLDETACSASDVCHAVFADMMTCDCNEPGCCVLFSACSPGGKANCRGAITDCGGRPTPVCNEEGTPEEFVLAYFATCAEGCVRPEDCRQAP